MNELLPWHAGISDRFERQVESNALPHGILLSGQQHSGKAMLAKWLVAKLLCREPDGPCDACDQCKLLQAQTHPDFLFLTPEESKKQIVVDQVRDVIDWANQTSQQGGRKVCVIDPCDAMNRQASNALLKCLEEPPKETFLVLVSAQPSQLLPTIRSRCQQVICHTPSRSTGLAWLKEQGVSDADLMLTLADGLPLKVVREFDEDYLQLRSALADALVDLGQGTGSPIRSAAQFAKSDPQQLIDILFGLTADVLNAQLANGTRLKNQDLQAQIRSIAASTDSEHEFQFLTRLGRMKAAVSSTSNANLQMLLEWLLVGSDEPLLVEN